MFVKPVNPRPDGTLDFPRPDWGGGVNPPLSTLKGQFQRLTSGQGHVVAQVDSERSCCISVDAYRRDEYIETISKFVTLSNR